MSVLHNRLQWYPNAYLLNTSGETMRTRAWFSFPPSSTALFILLLAFLPALANAHESRPGYLELKETEPGRYEVLFKVPMKGDARLSMYATLPETCRPIVPTASYAVSGALLERTTVICEGGLVGQRIVIQGLEALTTDVLVRVHFLDGTSIIRRLRPNAPSFVVPAAPSAFDVAQTYLVLGVQHMLSGADHLLFVLALMLLVKGFSLLFKTITAFTVAHSITLALAALGFVLVPGPPVEAVIALSILFLASEIARSRMGRPGWTERYPWVVAFTFGLLHGFGFAGALAQVGLPPADIPLALFLFNVGVELGQLLFVAAVLAGLAALRRAKIKWPSWAWRVPAYGIGSLAAFWCIERIVGFW